MPSLTRFKRIIKEHYDKRRPTIEEIVKLIQSIQDLNIRMYAAISYLIGARISEICRYRVPKYKSAKRVLIPNPAFQTGKYIDGVKPYDFVVQEKDGLKYLIFNDIRNEKNKGEGEKSGSIPLFYKEKELVEEFINWLVDKPRDAELFPHFRDYYNKKVKKELCRPWWYPHLFRDLRANNYVAEYKYNDQELVKAMGWTDSRPAKFYLDLNVDDLMNKQAELSRVRLLSS